MDHNIAVATWLAPVQTQHTERPGSRRQDTTAEVGDLWRILWRRKELVFGTALLLGLAVLAYALITPSLYTAAGQILIDPRDRQVVSNDVNPGALSPGRRHRAGREPGEGDRVRCGAGACRGPGGPGYGAGLRRRRRTPPSPGACAALRGMITGPQPERRADAARPGARPAAAQARCEARRQGVRDRRDRHHDGSRSVGAHRQCNRQRLSGRTRREARSDAAKRAAGDLRGRLDELRGAVSLADKKLEDYKAQNGLITSSGRLVNEQQLTDSNARLVAARARTAEAKARLQGIQ